MAVFGLLKRQGKVFTVVVENTQTETLMPVITRKIKPDSRVYTDTYRSYDVLDVSEFHHESIIQNCLRRNKITSRLRRFEQVVDLVT